MEPAGADTIPGPRYTWPNSRDRVKGGGVGGAGGVGCAGCVGGEPMVVSQ